MVIKVPSDLHSRQILCSMFRVRITHIHLRHFSLFASYTIHHSTYREWQAQKMPYVCWMLFRMWPATLSTSHQKTGKALVTTKVNFRLSFLFPTPRQPSEHCSWLVVVVYPVQNTYMHYLSNWGSNFSLFATRMKIKLFLKSNTK